ncbi:MAG: sigma 54-interacting transcriptional regulator [Polyangiales bacterium]
MTHSRRFSAVTALGPTTFRANEPTAARQVLIKEGPKADLSREVQLSLQLHHPSFRRCYGWCGEAALFEYIEGGAPTDLTAFAEGLLRALVCLHGHGVAHGDLKPENVLVQSGEDDHAEGQAGRVRVIDLGMARLFGELPVGGTPGYLAPELAAGEPLSVASDLYAVGKTLHAFTPTGLVKTLADQCAQEDPTRRPASAGAALSILGVTARPIDRSAERERLLRLPFEPAADARVYQGACPERAEEALFGAHFSSGGEARVLRFGSGQAPLLTLAEEAEPDADATQDSNLAARVVEHFAALDVPFVARMAGRPDEEARVALCALVRAALALQGVVVILDASEDLAIELERAGAECCPAPRYERAQAAELAAAFGATMGDATLDALWDFTSGGPSLQAFIARAAEDPTLRFEELTCARRTSPQEPSDLDAMSAAKLRARASRALDAGAGRRALRYLDALEARQTRTARRDAASMRARALALTGDLRGACAIPATRLPGRLRRAEWLLRLADFDGADAEAQRALQVAKGDDAARALCVRAQAARDAGRFTEARALAIEALSVATAPVQRLRASLIEADMASAQGDAESAHAIASRALSLALTERERAEVHARLGGALAALGRWDEASINYERARKHAREAGDPQGLPAYELNYATAAHALGRYGDALAGYEKAADLARTLDRIVTVAAALTNLASLYVALECMSEARLALSRAREACARSGYALYAAQCDLIEAETHRDDPARAITLASKAHAAFEELGAPQQAMEAALLWNELSLLPGASARQLPPLDERALRAAGLGPRLALHQGLRARNDGAWESALRLAQRATSESQDPALRIRGRTLCVECLTRLRPTESEEAQNALRLERETIAETLPPGLRRRFLPAPFDVRRGADGGLGEAARRLMALSRRVLLEPDESRVLRAALDEAVAITGAERAFLLRRGPRGAHHVLAARNLDGESVKRSRERFSRSIVEGVFETGESTLVAQANEDPDLASVRSVHEMGLRSVLCVPVHSPSAIVGVLYLDHRFAAAAFGPHEREWLMALGDVLGLGLENARLHAAAAARAEVLERETVDARRLNERQALEIARLQNTLAAPMEAHGLVGGSRAIQDAIRLATKVAPSMLPVLIEGESGTGKELFARLVHQRSERERGPLLAINCGAMTESLLESELFGHVRGAFTGALRDHPGLFRSAEGGTLFLDEIGEMPLRMQARLLRVLQENEIRPVGGNQTLSVDVRIVAATNRDLRQEIDAGRFRQDLYYRLAGVQVELPALRDRSEDLGELVAALSPADMRRLSPGAMRALIDHDFPGNVRELKQMLERAHLVAEGEFIAAEDLFTRSALPVSRQRAHAELDRSLIVAALRDADGNKSKAARDLGVSRMTLYRWMERHAIDRE